MGIYVTEVVWWNVRPLTFLIWGGVFERFPKLKVAITEGTTVWVPEYLALLDFRYAETPLRAKLGDYRSHLSMKPSEYFRATCCSARRACRAARRELRHEIGVAQHHVGHRLPASRGHAGR